jgi:hypothetical protein
LDSGKKQVRHRERKPRDFEVVLVLVLVLGVEIVCNTWDDDDTEQRVAPEVPDELP